MSTLAHIRHLIYAGRWSTARALASHDRVALAYVREHATRTAAPHPALAVFGNLWTANDVSRSNGSGTHDERWTYEIWYPRCIRQNLGFSDLLPDGGGYGYGAGYGNPNIGERGAANDGCGDGHNDIYSFGDGDGFGNGIPF